jgi:hypothetical protein
VKLEGPKKEEDVKVEQPKSEEPEVICVKSEVFDVDAPRQVTIFRHLNEIKMSFPCSHV